jgi:hypothetical protein
VRTSLGALVVALLLACCAAVGQARPLTDAEKQGLADTVKAFDAAMRGQALETVAKTIPPRVKEALAKRANITVDQLNASVVAQMKATLAKVKIESFGMDLAKAQYRELSNGEPYALIPTETLMDTGSGKIMARSDTLALLDSGVWYLLRVNEPRQLAILREVYPEFTAVQFSGGTMEAVK